MKKPKTKHSNGSKGESNTKSRFSLERLVFFSDAVFAIAITILVLDIRLPVDVDLQNSHELFQTLLGLWPEYLAFLISFWVIGLSWISHHRKFLYIKKGNNQLLVLNLLLLMVIAFIPFPTSVMSKSSSFTANAFYALTMIMANLSMLILWWYATHNRRLVDMSLDKSQIWREALPPLATIAIFVLSIGAAFIDAGLVRICWILVFPVYVLIRRMTT